MTGYSECQRFRKGIMRTDEVRPAHLLGSLGAGEIPNPRKMSRRSDRNAMIQILSDAPGMRCGVQGVRLQSHSLVAKASADVPSFVSVIIDHHGVRTKTPSPSNARFSINTLGVPPLILNT